MDGTTLMRLVRRKLGEIPDVAVEEPGLRLPEGIRLIPVYECLCCGHLAIATAGAHVDPRRLVCSKCGGRGAAIRQEPVR